MTFWEQQAQDLNAQIDPTVAGNVLGNLLAILGSSVGDPVAAAGASSTDYLPSETTWMPDQPDEAAPPPEINAEAAGQPFAGNYPVTGGYGEDRGGHIHAGIDFGVPSGTAILSIAAGTVVSAVNDQNSGGYGNMVVIDHGNGLQTRYAHLTNTNLSVGDQVAAGQVVGVSGSTGQSTGPHLHFEVLKDGVAVDPTPYLAGGVAILGTPSGTSENGAVTAKPLTPEEMAGIQVSRVEAILTTPVPGSGV